MPTQLNFDSDARAELLCYLVVSELVAKAMTGEWLRTDHLVESTRLWLAENGADCDWQDGVAIARLAADLAPAILASFHVTAGKELAALFAGGWRLDYRSPVVRDIHEVCVRYLRRLFTALALFETPT